MPKESGFATDQSGDKSPQSTNAIASRVKNFTLARDTKLDRDVAIKVLASEFAQHDGARKRFLREARAAAAVRHDNIVTIHSVDEIDGVQFLVMELVQGESLSDLLQREGPLLALEITRLAAQVAVGLSAAHKRGLVHCDIKPANILLERAESNHGPSSRVKITDFGLARAALDGVNIPSGVIAGTPQYMSPEQARGETLDHRADLFSLGSVMYTMCTGRAAFHAESTAAVLRRVTDDTVQPIGELNAAVPVWLVEIIDKLIAKRREDRFQNAAELANVLQQRLSEANTVILGVHEHQPHPPNSATTQTLSTSLLCSQSASAVDQRETSSAAADVPIRRSRSILLVTLLGVVLLAAAAVFLIRTRDGEYQITTDDPQIVSRLDEQGGIVVEDRLTKRQYTLRRGANRLPSGEYELVVTSPDGLELAAPKFQIKRGNVVSTTVVARAVANDNISSTPRSVPIDTGGWIDVLPLMDLSVDRIVADGTRCDGWTMDDGELAVTTLGVPAKVLLPLDVAEKAFELSVEFTRTGGGETGTIIVQLPVPNGVLSLRIDGNRHWAQFLAGNKPAPVSEYLLDLHGATRVETALHHTLHCQLSAVGDQHRLEVVFDGQPVDPWQGSIDSIKQQPGVGDPDAKRIGIVVTKSNFVFHRIRLRTLEGDATPVRDARAD